MKRDSYQRTEEVVPVVNTGEDRLILATLDRSGVRYASLNQPIKCRATPLVRDDIRQLTWSTA